MDTAYSVKSPQLLIYKQMKSNKIYSKLQEVIDQLALNNLMRLLYGMLMMNLGLLSSTEMCLMLKWFLSSILRIISQGRICGRIALSGLQGILKKESLYIGIISLDIMKRVKDQVGWQYGTMSHPVSTLTDIMSIKNN